MEQEKLTDKNRESTHFQTPPGNGGNKIRGKKLRFSESKDMMKPHKNRDRQKKKFFLETFPWKNVQKLKKIIPK